MIKTDVKERREMSARAKAWRPDLKVKKEDCVFFFDIREKGCYMFSLAFACKITPVESSRREICPHSRHRARCVLLFEHTQEHEENGKLGRGESRHHEHR